MANHFLGFGLGLRSQHYDAVIKQKPEVDWFEVISENYMVSGGKPKNYLHQVRASYPIVMHGVSMSIGSVDPINYDYLKSLKALINEFKPMWVSDHLCFTRKGNINSHDLLPLPYTAETLEHLVSRIHQVQDYLGREMIFENVSSYLTYQNSEMSEWEFLKSLHQASGCQFLLDINNIYVSSRNHHFDPWDYLNSIPAKAVAQIHLAGHRDFGTHVVDTHDEDVPDPVWKLFAEYAAQSSPVSTMIERDGNIPPLEDLIAELEKARNLAPTQWVKQQGAA